MEGVKRILNWMSFIPALKGGPLPILSNPLSDHPERDIDFVPPEGCSFDTRLLMTGQDGLKGLFDEDSWDEILQPWAQTVIVGRARLGGIPVGVVGVESRTVEYTIPADPANSDSESKVISQAGQVWFPDSAYKTAQAIFDFNREELPLVILANWRGFSGGMKDMYEEVVKFGAYIVDALHEYKQPILIYIPPFGELRGGSWVVVDPTINQNYMEMYADPTARGGVLEAEGLVSIKLRLREQREMMNRLDPEMKLLQQQLPSQNPEEVKNKMKEREEVLAPMYHTVAVHLADLHDTPVRMKEKGVIREIIPWENARTKLYWRLKRRLLEMRLMKEIDRATDVNQASSQSSNKESTSAFGHGQKMEMIRRWFIEDKGDNMRFLWDQDHDSVEWMESQIDAEGKPNSFLEENLKVLRRDACVNKFKFLLSEMCPDALHEAGVHLAQQLKESSKLTEFTDAVAQMRDESKTRKR